MLRFFVISFSFLFFTTNALGVAGVAEKYQVTMTKVELCTDATCSSPTTVASGSQKVDIASLNAGAEAAQFGKTTGLPVGTTFTHIRPTLLRSFTMKGRVNVSGSTWCSTDGNAAGNATALHTGTLKTGGQTPADPVDTTLYLSDADDYGSDDSVTISYGSPTYAISMSVGSPTSDKIQLIYKLSQPYTVGITTPKIKISFDTSKALGAAVDGGNNCLMWPEEPVTVISLTD